MSNIEKSSGDKSELQTYSERFIQAIEDEYSGIIGKEFKLDEHHRKLAFNMMNFINSALNEAEAKRISNKQTNKTPYTWSNVNMGKCARDSIHRIMLGLDAMIPNHVSAIPRWNSKINKYDLAIQVGYVGKDYYRRKFAIDPPKDIIYELVHEHEKENFIVHKKNLSNPVESYSFEITNPFDRGEVIGGFGYIMYEDETKNKLVIIDREHFRKAKEAAQTNAFWGKYETEMQYKTVVHRTTEKLQIDPKKVNESYHYVEAQERSEALGTEDNGQNLIDISVPEAKKLNETKVKVNDQNEVVQGNARVEALKKTKPELEDHPDLDVRKEDIFDEIERQSRGE